jgi:dihydrofolate synthase/folylpolyglutamate synthase
VKSHALLSSLELHGIKLGLETISQLLEAGGNPHLEYPTIHVAGTNGKGSVVAMLDAMLRAAGYTTARFTSPHLVDLNERFLFNAAPISDAELESELRWHHDLIETWTFRPTFFEVVTSIAFRWFASKKPDAALIEVGLGGRLDSTNVVTPDACAITSIDYDHMRYLGDTLELIAAEKAGILKTGVPCIVSETKEGPLRVIDEIASERGTPLSVLNEDFDFTISGPAFEQRISYQSPQIELTDVPLALPGRHQGSNAATAIALAEILFDRYPSLDVEAIKTGLGNAKWPGRLERVLDNPPVILDVAHNVAGARTAAEAFEQCVVILAVSSDKNAAEMIHHFSRVARPLILTQFQGPRATPIEVLAESSPDHSFLTSPSIADAIDRGLELATPKCPLLITGSVFTVGEAREILIAEHGAPPITF